MNFPRDDVMVFGVTGKRMPFRTPLEVHRNATYRDIYVALKENKAKVYIVDDSTYLMQFDNFRRAKEKGYDKYVDMAVNFQTLLDAAAKTDDDTTVWFLHHPQFGDDGSSKPQTIGKMLDNQLCVEGLFDIVLECAVIDGWLKSSQPTDLHQWAECMISLIPPRLYDLLKLESDIPFASKRTAASERIILGNAAERKAERQLVSA